MVPIIGRVLAEAIVKPVGKTFAHQPDFEMEEMARMVQPPEQLEEIEVGYVRCRRGRCLFRW